MENATFQKQPVMVGEENKDDENYEELESIKISFMPQNQEIILPLDWAKFWDQIKNKYEKPNFFNADGSQAMQIVFNDLNIDVFHMFIDFLRIYNEQPLADIEYFIPRAQSNLKRVIKIISPKYFKFIEDNIKDFQELLKISIAVDCKPLLFIWAVVLAENATRCKKELENYKYSRKDDIDKQEELIKRYNKISLLLEGIKSLFKCE